MVQSSNGNKLLKKAGLIEEVDFKKYRLTSKGEEILKEKRQDNQEVIDFKYLLKKLKKLQIMEFGFILTDEPKEERKEIDIYEELEKTLKKEEEIENLEVPEEIEGNCKIGNYEKKELVRKKENVNKKVKTKK